MLRMQRLVILAMKKGHTRSTEETGQAERKEGDTVAPLLRPGLLHTPGRTLQAALDRANQDLCAIQCLVTDKR